MRRLYPLLTALILNGCAGLPFGASSYASYVTDLSTDDAVILASAITVFISQLLPAASSTLVLQPPPKGQAGNALTPALIDALTMVGFALAEPAQGAQGPTAHKIRYLITPLDKGVLMRVQIDDQTQASRWYTRTGAGLLEAGSPFTVRVAAQ